MPWFDWKYDNWNRLQALGTVVGGNLFFDYSLNFCNFVKNKNSLQQSIAKIGAKMLNFTEGVLLNNRNLFIIHFQKNNFGNTPTLAALQTEITIIGTSQFI